MASKIYLLVKVFDKEEYAEAFINEGAMLCRTLEYFRCIENDGARGDVYEGVSHWLQPEQTTLMVSIENKDDAGQPFPISSIVGPITMRHSLFDKLNLFCMYAIKIQEFEESYETEEEKVKIVEIINKDLKIQTRLTEEALSLGEFAVVIYKVEDFINKVKEVAGAQKLKCLSCAVEYYDPETFHGVFSGLEPIFRKRNIYAPQNEYRFAFSSNTHEEKRVIRIGSLDGIAFKVPTRIFNGSILLKLDESNHQE